MFQKTLRRTTRTNTSTNCAVRLLNSESNPKRNSISHVQNPIEQVFPRNSFHHKRKTYFDLLMALFSFFSSCFILPMAALYLAAVSLWTNSLLVLVCSASMTFKRGEKTGWAARHNDPLIISINSNFIISPISSCQQSEDTEKNHFKWTYLEVFPKKSSGSSNTVLIMTEVLQHFT